MADRDVRQARAEDHDAVAAFTEETWRDREAGDYVPDVFPEWVATDGSDQRTVVATVDGTPVGVCRARLLGGDEAWLGGLRVAPDHRGAGHGQALVADLFEWCRERGATVARNLVFGWNGAGMGQSRAVGFEPVTACRWVRPEADAGATVEGYDVREDTNAAWRFWTHSDARGRLSGLARATDDRWALSELDRARFERLAEEGRALALVDGGTRAMAVRIETRDGERTVAEYAAGAWTGADSAAGLLAAVRADAAACGADEGRLLVPDTPGVVSDVAALRCGLDETTHYVFAADLTGGAIRR